MQTWKPFMGIEIGGTKLQLVTGTAAGEILTRHRFEIDKQRGAQGIRNIIEETINKNYRAKIGAVGVGFGGPVNWKTGKISTSFHIDGWSDFEIVKWLERIAGAPVFVENDANVAALGEAVLGAGKGFDLVLYVTIGSGIGGGLVVKNEIYHGDIPGEVEIGHLRMNREGDTLQSLCSGWGIDGRIRKLIARNPESVLAKLVGTRDSGEAAFLKIAIEQNDNIAAELFEQVTDDLAFGLSHAVHLFHPEMLILGGGFSLVGDILECSIKKKMPHYLMKAFHPGPVIRLAHLQELSVPTGALLVAAQNFHSAKPK